jgi:hypothetical protein
MNVSSKMVDGVWVATLRNNGFSSILGWAVSYGETPLIAAMLCNTHAG